MSGTKGNMATATEPTLGSLAAAWEGFADLAGVAAASATGMLDGLERAAVVSRLRSSTDRRRVTVSLTPSGRMQIERKHLDIDAKRREFFADLDSTEREQTERTLRRLATLIGEL